MGVVVNVVVAVVVVVWRVSSDGWIRLVVRSTIRISLWDVVTASSTDDGRTEVCIGRMMHQKQHLAFFFHRIAGFRCGAFHVCRNGFR